MKILEWEKEIKKLNDEELKKIKSAFLDILSWETFNKEYKEFGLGVLHAMLVEEYSDRLIHKRDRLMKWVKEVEISA